MAQKPSIPKGTRDFLPQQMIRRNYIFDTIRNAYVRYGYLPIETPAMEKTDTLLGKYGEEGDRLIFRVLNSGNFLEKARVRKHVLKDIAQHDSFKLDLFVGDFYPLGHIVTPKEIVGDITKRALRYDLTVPFARFVVQNQNDISFPFKRYQIQPVWRADRPQKGRYREFYQCDADVVGSDSLLYEVELTQLIDEVFTELKVPHKISINNRKILQGIAEAYGVEDRFVDMVTAIDKLHKIGADGVAKELGDRGFTEKESDGILKFLGTFTGDFSNQQKLDQVKGQIGNSVSAQKGVEELSFVLNTVEELGLKSAQVDFDITLARGLDYYTGAIFEVTSTEGKFNSSILGGGRYDDLTGLFGMPDVSGVGISFGADRIYDVLEELNLFPEFSGRSTQLMFVNFGEKEQDYCLPKLKLMREAGINAEIYPSSAKLKKQFKYADDKNIPFVAIIGSNEMENGQAMIKDMSSGEQVEMSWDDVIKKLTNG